MKPEQYFKDYPYKEKCYQTSDEIIFHHKGDAHLHAKSLKDDEVVEHKAVQFIAEAKEPKPEKAPKENKPAKGKEQNGETKPPPAGIPGEK